MSQYFISSKKKKTFVSTKKVHGIVGILEKSTKCSITNEDS